MSEPETTLAPTLEWTSHPLRSESWHRSISLGALLAASSAAAWIGLDGFAYGLLALLVLAASVSRYLLPTSYAVDASAVRRTHLLRTRTWPWTAFRRVDRHRDGLFLSPFDRGSRLDSFRGVFLPLGPNGSEVTTFVRSRVQGQSD
mgnify:CR=1 FL=1|jgi:hypothetical protein